MKFAVTRLPKPVAPRDLGMSVDRLSVSAFSPGRPALRANDSTSIIPYAEPQLSNVAFWHRFESVLLALARSFTREAQVRGVSAVTTIGWHHSGGGLFVYGPRTAFWVHQSLGAEYVRWPLYADLVVASRFSPLTEHLNDLIGGSGMRTRLDLQTFTLGSLSRALHTSASGVELDEAVIKRRVADLKGLSEDDEIENETLVLIDGVLLETAYDLGGGVDIRMLNSDAMASFISSGAIPVAFEAGKDPSVTISPSQWVALRRSRREAKTTSRSGESSRMEISPDTEARMDFDRLADAFAIIAGIRPRFLGWRSQLANDVLQTGWLSGRGSDLYEGTPAAAIPADGRLAVAWTAMKVAHGVANLLLPIRRLGFAAMRERWEDRLLDVMIALEALLLRDQQEDRNELRFRAALRAAHWWPHGHLGLMPGQVYDIVRRAYDFRSTLSHGGTVDETKTVSVGGERYTHDKVVSVAHAIARALAEKALTTVLSEKRYAVDWENMLGNHLNRLQELS